MAGLTPLLLICHVTLVSAVLQPPTNVTITSHNFQHILTWEDPNHEPDIYYQVFYEEIGKSVVPKKNCFNITNRYCDLTKDFTDIMSEYVARVRCVTEHEVSDPALSTYLCPISGTSLGPPLVNVVPCDHCIQVSLDPPISHLWSEEEQRSIGMVDFEVYPILTYKINYGRSTEDTHSMNADNTTIIQKLLPNTNYCVSVDIWSSLNSAPSIPSAQQCVTTGPGEGAGLKLEVIIPVVIAVVLFIGILVVLFVLDIAGYICKRRSFFPKVLKSFSHSESIYSCSNERVSPTCTPVQIESQKLEVKESQRTEALYQDGGYASRKKLLDGDSTGNTSTGDTSAGDSSGPILSSNSLSLESSGQVTGSSDEERLSTMRPIDVDIISPVVADTSSDLPFNNSGGFNVNLDSICMGASIDMWTGLNHGGSMKEEPTREPDLDSGQAGLSLNGDTIVCTSDVLVDLDSIEYGSDHSEEELSDNPGDCDSDDRVVSGYMRR